MGLKDFYTSLENKKIDNPIFLRRSLRRLKRLQRIHARRIKKATKVYEYQEVEELRIPILTKSGSHKYTLKLSKNSKKSLKHLTKYYYKVSNQRNDFLHKESRKLINKHKFNCYAVEDLKLQNMQKNRKLSRAISDASWYSFLTKLEYKSKWKTSDQSKHFLS
jgi:putative transposase